MFTVQVLVRQGLNFSGYLFKNDKSIGGLGNSIDGIYVRLRESLTVSEMKELMSFIEGLNPKFINSSFDLSFINEQ